MTGCDDDGSLDDTTGNCDECGACDKGGCDECDALPLITVMAVEDPRQAPVSPL